MRNCGLTPLSDKKRLSLPIGRKDEASKQYGLHKVFARDIYFDSVIMLTQAKQNSDGRMNITFFQETLDKSLTNLLLCTLTHGTQSKQHPV
jgi:hypothetical protein